MKRFILTLILTTLLCGVGFAEGNKSADVDYRFTSGGFFIAEDDVSGGYGEFGIRLVPESSCLVLRTAVFVEGYGSYGNLPVETSALAVGDKLLFGGRYNCQGFIVRSYGLFAASASMFRGQDHDFFNPNLLLTLFSGMGFELQFTSQMAFVIECGGNSSFVVGPQRKSYSQFTNASPFLTIGYRSFF